MSSQEMSTSPFNTIEEAIEDIRNGKMVIVVDDEDRENEGDFLMAADKVTPEAINIMVKYGRGLVCMPITKERAAELDLDYMVTEGARSEERRVGKEWRSRWAGEQ